MGVSGSQKLVSVLFFTSLLSNGIIVNRIDSKSNENISEDIEQKDNS